MSHYDQDAAVQHLRDLVGYHDIMSPISHFGKLFHEQIHLIVDSTFPSIFQKANRPLISQQPQESRGARNIPDYHPTPCVIIDVPCHPEY